jgi:hypothetical protein
MFPHVQSTAVTSGTTALNNPEMKNWQANAPSGIVPYTAYPTLQGHMRLSKLQGMTPTEYQGDNGNTASVTALPTRTCWWEVLVVPKGTITATLQVWLVVDYLVEFYERLPGDDSTRLLREIALTKREQKLVSRPPPKQDVVTDVEFEEAKAYLNLGLGGTPEQSPSLSWEDVPSFSLGAGGGHVDRGDRKGIAGGSFATKSSSVKKGK